MTWDQLALAEALEQIPAGVAITLPDGAIEYANSYLRRLLGLTGTQLPGPGLPDSRFVTGAGQAEKFRWAMLAGQSWHGEVAFTAGGEGTWRAFESVYPLRDHAGAVTGFVHFVQELGAFQHAETLRELAFYDSLTGLPNRNLLEDRLTQAIAGAQRGRSGFALLFIDVDHFKRVNDSLGHDAGDDLLCQVAGRLRQTLRKSDTLARWGGDEFVAIVEGVVEPGLAAKMVDKLLSVCNGDYDLSGSTQRAALSVGVSLYPRDGIEMKALLKRADMEMYRAKAAARNGFQVREPRRADQYKVA